MEKRPLLAGSLAGIAGFVWFTFWLHRQRFYDDDYGRWLNPSQDVSWGSALWNLLRPFPPDWGFLDRPALMLGFKIHDGLFGAYAAPMFWAKAALAGILVAVLFVAAHEIVRLGGATGRAAMLGGIASALLFVTAEPVFASLAWASDSEIAAQLCVVAGLAIYLVLLERHADEDLLSREAIGLQLLLFAVAFVGFKTKGSAKILPMILVLHLLWCRRGALRPLAPLVVALIAVNVPWGHVLQSPLPPIVDFGGEASREGFYWHAANGQSFLSLFVGGGFDLWPFGESTELPHGLLQLLVPFGLIAVAVLPLLAAIGSPRPAGSHAKLLAIWIGLHVVFMSSYPHIPEHLLGRYLLGVLAPLSVVVGAGLGLASCQPGWRRWASLVVGAALLLQIGVGIRNTSLRKRTWCAQVVVSDQFREDVENDYQDANIALVDLPDNGYATNESGNRYYEIDSSDPRAEFRINSLILESRSTYIASPRPPKEGSPWRQVGHWAIEDDLYWRIVGTPLGACERYLYSYQ